MSFIDGQQGCWSTRHRHRDLASSSTFEETVYLLWNKKLPTQAELDAFTKDLRANYDPPAGVLEMVKGMPKDAQPMHVLRTLVSSLALFDDSPNANDVPSAREKSLKDPGRHAGDRGRVRPPPPGRSLRARRQEPGLQRKLHVHAQRREAHRRDGEGL